MPSGSNTYADKIYVKVKYTAALRSFTSACNLILQRIHTVWSYENVIAADVLRTVSEYAASVTQTVVALGSFQLCTVQLCNSVVPCSWKESLSPTDQQKVQVNEEVRPVNLYSFIFHTAIWFQVTQLPQLDEFACFVRWFICGRVASYREDKLHCYLFMTLSQRHR